ncbi:MAG: aromatic ring-hydroxylating dioxygenase subunit alpha [Candidatus Paceibacterota bacterium]
MSDVIGLKGDFYADADFFKTWQQIYAEAWTLVGFTSEVPNSGDVLLREVAGHPLMLVRGKDKQLRCFHNFCRHRGMPLVAKEKCNKKKFICPYHAWRYELDGTLLRRPHFESPGKSGGKDENLNLKSVQIAEWLGGAIFVNLSATEVPFKEYIKPLAAFFEGLSLQDFRYDRTETLEVSAHWIPVVENWMDSYHVPAVHPGLNEATPIDLRQQGRFVGNCFLNETNSPGMKKGEASGLPVLSQGPDTLNRWGFLAPNLGISVRPDHTLLFEVVPVAPDKTVERLHFLFVGDSADNPEYAAGRQQVIEAWTEVNNEDVDLLRRLQPGIISSAYDGGCLTGYWDEPVRAFQKWLSYDR